MSCHPKTVRLMAQVTLAVLSVAGGRGAICTLFPSIAEFGAAPHPSASPPPSPRQRGEVKGATLAPFLASWRG
jgi:hypothetical protein